MKTFWQYARNALIIVTLWWSLITLYGHARVKMAGVTPTFPYYNSLLQKTDAEHGVWGHFDGVHYLKLAEHGYVDIGTQAFFPVYPLLIREIHNLTDLPFIEAGRVIGFISLFFACICLFYLFQKQAWATIVILLTFPTSFYMAGIYTEALFLFETLLFFILLKQKQFFLAACIAGIASGTRIVGSLLTLSLAVEMWRAFPRTSKKQMVLKTITYGSYLIIALAGLLAYTYFLWEKFGDPIMFIHVQSMFASGRSSGEIIYLPQVLYRYVKIFLTVSPTTILLWRAIFEFGIFAAFLWQMVRVWRKLPLSWSVYILTSLVLPTLSGTLSSLPRYMIVLVPFLITRTLSKHQLALYLILALPLMLYCFALYAKGIFVA